MLKHVEVVFYFVIKPIIYSVRCTQEARHNYDAAFAVLDDYTDDSGEISAMGGADGEGVWIILPRSNLVIRQNFRVFV